MRPDTLYLRDIVEAADAIERFLIDVEEGGFRHDEVRQSAVVQKLTVIGKRQLGFPATSSKVIPRSNGARSSACGMSSCTSTSRSRGPACGRHVVTTCPGFGSK